MTNVSYGTAARGRAAQRGREPAPVPSGRREHRRRCTTPLRQGENLFTGHMPPGSPPQHSPLSPTYPPPLSFFFFFAQPSLFLKIWVQSGSTSQLGSLYFH